MDKENACNLIIEKKTDALKRWYERQYENLKESCSCKDFTYSDAQDFFRHIPIYFLYSEIPNGLNKTIDKILKTLYDYCIKEEIIAPNISYKEFCRGKGLCDKLYPLPIKEFKEIYEECDCSNTYNERYHEDLVSSCSFSEFYYRLSFRRRIEFKLGVVYINIDLYPYELEVLSNEELESRLNSIEKPWWDDLFEEIEDDKRLLHILYGRGCSLDDLKTLYNAIRSNDTETIDSMEKRAKTIMFKVILPFKRTYYIGKEIVSAWKEYSLKEKAWLSLLLLFILVFVSEIIVLIYAIIKFILIRCLR